MVLADIEQLKQQYTDKYVMVDANQPELARFREVVGRVKTVNMSGRALVEFSDYHTNIGWYDIDMSFLKVVDKPLPKQEKVGDKKAPAGAAKPPVAAGKPSTADILAAARSGAKAPAKPAGSKPSTADILAAARGGKAAAPSAAKPAPAKDSPSPEKNAGTPAVKPAAPARIDRSKMSVADMLAAARAGGAAKAVVPTESVPQAEASPATAAPESPVGAASAAAKKSADKLDKSQWTVDQMIAWCRAHDAK
jgi:hypothetical protein